MGGKLRELQGGHALVKDNIMLLLGVFPPNLIIHVAWGPTNLRSCSTALRKNDPRTKGANPTEEAALYLYPLRDKWLKGDLTFNRNNSAYFSIYERRLQDKITLIQG